MTTSRGSILLVDDEPVALRGHARLLERLGFRVHATDRSDEAVGIVAAGGVEVVLTDVQMPERSGPELAHELRAIDPGLQIVYLSGAPNIETLARSAAEGAPFLAKPVNVLMITSTLDDAVARHRRQAASREPESLAARFEAAVRGLRFHYQPIVRADTGAVAGWEALMRPASGFVGPLELLDAAQRLDRFSTLGRAVRRLAPAPWPGVRGRELLFCNVHPSELLDDDLFDSEALLSRMAPSTVLEITEMRSLHDIPEASRRIATLREMGFTIALDDLGAGQAGLGTLMALDPQMAKLDAHMIRGLDQSPRRRRVLGSIVRLCRDLGIEVVAEGIETETERVCAIELGCDLLQGYALGRPAELASSRGA